MKHFLSAIAYKSKVIFHLISSSSDEEIKKSDARVKRISKLAVIALLFLLPVSVLAQKIIYSAYQRGDTKNINFEIIGKVDENILVYKNIPRKHKLSVFDSNMQNKEINLDFIPAKTFNADFIIYPNFFYMIYQYQKKNIVYCMGIKIDGNGNKISEPVVLDTTRISVFADNKIYNVINSDNKQRIMIFKAQRKSGKTHISTMLLNDQLQVIKKDKQVLELNEQRDSYGNFLLDNDGSFIFTVATEAGNRDYHNGLTLFIKTSIQDTFAYHTIDLEKKYLDNIKLKIDNLNGRYIINSFYYNKNISNIEGLFTWIWNKIKNEKHASTFTPFNDSLRQEAKSNGTAMRSVFNEFIIDDIIVKKDGGFLLLSEEYYIQNRSFNQFNRWDLLNPFLFSSSSYYLYNRYYGYYRPMNSSNQSVRYYYYNIMILSMDNTGSVQWSKVIHKNQVDDNDNFLSYYSMNSGGEIHFLFNADSRNQIVADYSASIDGSIKRNATLKSQEKGYEFMPRLAKQVGAQQVVIPCIYRGHICFAKVDF